MRDEGTGLLKILSPSVNMESSLGLRKLRIVFAPREAPDITRSAPALYSLETVLSATALLIISILGRS